VQQNVQKGLVPRIAGRSYAIGAELASIHAVAHGVSASGRVIH
jgi:hypothetical protein